MRGHGIPVVELPIARGQRPAILEMHSPLPIHLRDRDHLAVGRPKTWFPTVRQQKQAIVGRNFHRAPFVNVKRMSLAARDHALLPSGRSGYDFTPRDLHHFQRFAATTPRRLPAEPPNEETASRSRASAAALSHSAALGDSGAKE